MKMTKDEILSQCREIIGERNDDTVLNFLENLSDTLETDNIDWQKKYNELDTSWREKYKDRFFNTSNKTDEVIEDKENDETQLTFENLFKEGE